jgi:hypothetical protein
MNSDARSSRYLHRRVAAYVNDGAEDLVPASGCDAEVAELAMIVMT